MKRLLLIIAFSMAVLASCFVLIGADDSDAFTVDQITYSTYKDGDVTVAKVTGIDDSLTSVTIPATVAYGSKTYDVKTVSFQTIERKLISLTLSEGIENLEDIGNCYNLREVSIPESVTTIGERAFSECVSLHSLYLPDSVTSIGRYAFSGSGLVSVRLPEGSGFTVLSEGMFSGCTQLTSVAIPSNVTTIGASCFSGCSRLQQIVIPANVASIGDFAFSGCAGLTFIDLRCDESTEFGYNSLYGHYDVPGAVKIRTSVAESILRAAEAINETALVRSDLEFGYMYTGNTIDGETANHAWELVDGYLKVWATKQSNTVLDKTNGNPFMVKDSDGYYKSVLDLIFYVEFVEDIPEKKYLLTDIYTDSFWQSPVKTIVLPEGVKMVQNYGLYMAQLVKIPSTLTDFNANDNNFANSIQVSDSVGDGFTYPYLDAPCIIMKTGAAIVDGGYLENLSTSENSVLFLDGSKAMISGIKAAGLYPGCAYISDTNGKVYKYDEDEGVWVQDSSLRTVEFNLNDGSGLKTRMIVKNVVGDGGIGFVPGKDFAGWFTAASGGDYYSPDTAVGSGYLTRLYAHWDGAQVLLGTGVTLTVDGTSYTGWATVPIDGTATVSFEDGYGIYCAPGFNVSGSTLTPISGSHTFAVMAQPVECTVVTLDLNGGTGNFTSYSATIGSSAPSDFQAPTKAGYDFAGYKNAQNKVVITASGIYGKNVSGYTDSARHWINENSAVTLTAAWTAHTTAVTFNNMGVVADVTATATYGQDFPFVDSPTSSDARFDGYYDSLVDGKAAGNLVIKNGHNYAEDGSQYFSDNYTWAGDIPAYTLYAKWVPKYTLVNDATGNSYELSGDQPLEISAPSKVGYTFAGWKLTGDADFTIAVYGPEGNVTASIVEDTAFAADSASIYVASLSSTVGGTVHLEPQWTAIKYKVAFDLDGGTGSFPTKTYTYDAKYAVAEPTRSGWIFLGWTVSGDADDFSECSDTKNGTYRGMSETEPSKNTTSPGASLYVRNLSTAASKTTTLVANWAPGTYTIRYVANASDATGYMDIQTCYIGREYNLVLNAYSKTGYSFMGWSTASTGSVEYTDQQAVSNLAGADEVFTLYAVWQINQYTIHFASTGDSVVRDIVQDYGTPVTAPANPEKAGYTFAGWSPAIPSVMPADDITCTAQWTVSTYVVTFNANGGKGTMAAQTIEYLTSTTLSANAFTRTGYSFSSWNTTADGSGTTYANRAAVIDLGNVTLYAQWAAIKYYVEFHDNTPADNTVRQTMTYAKSAALRANTFSNAPYDFLSWNTVADGTGTSYADKQTVKNLANTSGAVVHLYAQWDVPVTAITLAKGEGTSDGSATAKYGGSSAVIVSPATGDLRLAGYYSGDVLVINPDGTYPAYASAYVSNGVWVCTDSTLVLTAKWRAPYDVGDVFEDSGVMFRITSVSPDQVEAFDVSEPTDTIRIPGVAGYMGTNFAVVSIAEDGFSGCETAVFVSIPDSVRAIGPGAFYGIVFYEANGTTVLQKTAEALSGYQYMGSDGKLVREGISVGDQFVYQGLKYEVTSVEPYTATVIGYEGTLKNLDVPLYAVHKGINLSVTAIGTQAFYKCKTLVTASLGGVAKVGVKAFAGCTKLTTVDVGEKLSTISAYGFWGCTSLVDIDLRDSAKTMRSIGSYAFYNDAKLSSITIPSYMTLVSDAEGTFSLPFQDADGKPLEVSADALKGYRYDNVNGVFVRDEGVQIGKEYSDGVLNYKVIATLPYELEVIGYNGTIRALYVPETIVFDDYEFVVSSIGVNAFNGCKTMKTANLGHVDTIKSQAFYGCTGLKTIDMPYVVSIGTKAFARCTSLTDPVFGERLATISAYGFWGCTALKDVDLPDTVTSIGTYAFQRCSSLSSIDLGKSLRLIGTKAFDGTAIESLEIPSSIVRLKEGSLAGCSELRTVSMAGGQKVILHMGLFEGTPGIQTIVMPDSFKKIYAGAFDGVTFHKANGADLPVKAANLAGHVFIGADCDLTLDDYCTVGFGVQPNGSGTVSETSLEVRYGAPMFVVDGVLYADNTPVYATPAPGYELTGWLYSQAVEDITVYAMFAEI